MSCGRPRSLAQGIISSWSSVISATRYSLRSPYITACEIQRDCFRSFSRFAGVRFLPPAVMMMLEVIEALTDLADLLRLRRVLAYHRSGL
jgi:hypothetical protein